MVIPNDATNGGRALLLLDKAGLITLKDKTNILSTPKDITANPKNLKFRELEAATIPRVLTQVDLAVGGRLPAYCTSMGRILLAALDASFMGVSTRLNVQNLFDREYVSLSVISPALSSNNSARPPLVASFGITTVEPSLISSSFLYLLE